MPSDYVAELPVWPEVCHVHGGGHIAGLALVLPGLEGLERRLHLRDGRGTGAREGQAGMWPERQRLGRAGGPARASVNHAWRGRHKGGALAQECMRAHRQRTSLEGMQPAGSRGGSPPP